jgi:hypothetical protein
MQDGAEDVAFGRFMRKAKAQNWLRSDDFHHLWYPSTVVVQNSNTICIHGLKTDAQWWK